MQPSKDAASELGRSESVSRTEVSEQEYVVWKHMDIGAMLLGRCERVRAGVQPGASLQLPTSHFTIKCNQIHHSEPNWLLHNKIPWVSEQ